MIKIRKIIKGCSKKFVLELNRFIKQTIFIIYKVNFNKIFRKLI